jgi:hypothetical protein
VSAKAADSALVNAFAFEARAGLPCGQDFLIGKFLEAHPEFGWQGSALRDMKGNPWAEFKIGDRSPSHGLSKSQSGQ